MADVECFGDIANRPPLLPRYFLQVRLQLLSVIDSSTP